MFDYNDYLDQAQAAYKARKTELKRQYCLMPHMGDADEEGWSEERKRALAYGKHRLEQGHLYLREMSLAVTMLKTYMDEGRESELARHRRTIMHAMNDVDTYLKQSNEIIKELYPCFS